ncbi:hypothetical protein KAU11_07455, partial [Candidatus Babeliales bacterium]|nr:hypothetical protein [Candidatus Babeliales bacterium]
SFSAKNKVFIGFFKMKNDKHGVHIKLDGSTEVEREKNSDEEFGLIIKVSGVVALVTLILLVTIFLFTSSSSFWMYLCLMIGIIAVCSSIIFIRTFIDWFQWKWRD